MMPTPNLQVMIGLRLYAEIPIGDITDGCDVDTQAVLWFVQRMSPLPEFGLGAPISAVHDYALMSVGADGATSTRGRWKRTARISPFGAPDFAVHSDGRSFVHRVGRDRFRWARASTSDETYRTPPADAHANVDLPGVEAVALVASGLLFFSRETLKLLEHDCKTIRHIPIGPRLPDDETDVYFVRGGDSVAFVIRSPEVHVILDEEARIIAQGTGLVTDIRGVGSAREWLVLGSDGAHIRGMKGSSRAVPLEYPLDELALFFSPPVLCTGDVIAVFGEEGHVWQWTSERSNPPVQSLKPNSTTGFQWVRACGDLIAVFEQGRAMLFHR